MPRSASKTQKPKTISEKIATLDASVEWFYGEDFTLDAALEKYKTATSLAKEIEQDLAELKNQVTIIGDFTKE